LFVCNDKHFYSSIIDTGPLSYHFASDYYYSQIEFCSILKAESVYPSPLSKSV